MWLFVGSFGLQGARLLSTVIFSAAGSFFVSIVLILLCVFLGGEFLDAIDSIHRIHNDYPDESWRPAFIARWCQSAYSSNNMACHSGDGSLQFRL